MTCRSVLLLILPMAALTGLLGHMDTSTHLLLLLSGVLGVGANAVKTEKQPKRRKNSMFFILLTVLIVSAQLFAVFFQNAVNSISLQQPTTLETAGDVGSGRPSKGHPQTPQVPRDAFHNRSLIPGDRIRRNIERPARSESKRKQAERKRHSPDGLNEHKLQDLEGTRTKEKGKKEEEKNLVTLPPVDFSKSFGGNYALDAHVLKTISIVFPCAQEPNAMNTVEKFCERTPPDALAEIIVVDDGSKPPLQEVFAKDPRRLDNRQKCKVKFVRNEITVGLMAAKLAGGRVATGEVIAFFDCHCSPNKGWHEEILQQISDHPRRMVVPLITDLDLDTFDEKQNSAANAKCYLSFDGDFKWFDDDSEYIPTISGGLVAVGKEWFNKTGGFDEEMHGWGGENLDQSLRAWLCGGEIARAKSSRVAHMWRTADRRTSAHYHVQAKPTNNRGRVATAWFDAFLPVYRGGKVPLAEVDNYKRIKEALNCRPLSYFFYRFRKIYIEGGIIPRQVFLIKEAKSGLCIQKSGTLALLQCDEKVVAQQFQRGNIDKRSGACCSGIRAYRSNDCLDFWKNGPHWYSCDITGSNTNQHYFLSEDGYFTKGQKTQGEECLYVTDQKELSKMPCDQLHGDAGIWQEIHKFIPHEYTIYQEELERHKYAEMLPELPDN